LIPGKKSRQGEKWKMIVASSGDSVVVDEAIHDIELFLGEKIEPQEKTPASALFSMRKEIGDVAYATYKKYKDRSVENPEFELLLGAADKDSTILYITCEGKNQILDKFGIIGSGRVTGGELLLGQFLKEDLTREQAARLATLVISIVGHVDMYVGGEPQIYMCKNRTVWRFEEKSYQGILEESESRWALLKKLWVKMQEDETFESKLRDLLK
jgi:hypothetical protein